jgi:hypothetical protein
MKARKAAKKKEEEAVKEEEKRKENTGQNSVGKSSLDKTAFTCLTASEDVRTFKDEADGMGKGKQPPNTNPQRHLQPRMPKQRVGQARDARNRISYRPSTTILTGKSWQQRSVIEIADR